MAGLGWMPPAAWLLWPGWPPSHRRCVTVRDRPPSCWQTDWRHRVGRRGGEPPRWGGGVCVAVPVVGALGGGACATAAAASVRTEGIAHRPGGVLAAENTAGVTPRAAGLESRHLGFRGRRYRRLNIAGQGAREFRRRLIPCGRVLHHHAFENRRHAFGHRGSNQPRRLRLTGLMPNQLLGNRPVRKRRFAGEQEIKRRPQAVDIRPDVDFVAIGHLLRRQVVGSSEDVFFVLAREVVFGVVEKSRQAHVEQFHDAVATDHDVAGFDVAMDQFGDFIGVLQAQGGVVDIVAGGMGSSGPLRLTIS